MENKRVIIIGSGGHGAEIDEYIATMNKHSNDMKIQVAGFLDDNPSNYASYQFSAPLLGNIKKHRIQHDVFYVIGIANQEYRRTFVEYFLENNAQFMNIIHPAATISKSASMGTGNVIGPMVNIGPNVKIGDFNLVNSRSSLGHDTTIGNYNFISPNVSFSGFTKVGDDNLFGINSATIPDTSIGSRNRIMAGMIIDKPVKDDSTVFYRYKEKIMAIRK